MKKLFKAKIFHKRFAPRVNQFTYKGFYISISIDHLDELKSKFFSVNRFNLFSFYEKDHGERDGSSLRLWAMKKLNSAGITNCDEIFLQTFPRVMGHVFNPVSFWFCYNQKELVAIIAEVNNTFGESHNYLIRKKKSTLNKEFHVSPFFPRAGQYDFDFSNENLAIINYKENNNLKLATYIKGEEITWSDISWPLLFFRYPFYSLFVVFLIHYQALKLVFKKASFHKQPKKLEKELTYEH